MFDQRFPEKRAFITGAASGLGLEIAEQLSRNGWRLLICDINADTLAEAEVRLTGLGGTIMSMVINVTQPREIEAAAARIREEWGGVDVIFNNAGVAGAGAMEDLSLDEWNRLLSTDLWSVIYGCRVFIPMMKAQGGGYIVNTASSAGTLSAAQMANYNVAKAGVVSLSETLKVELADHNIGVTVICPTVFKTNLDASMKEGTAFEKNLKQQVRESKYTSARVVDLTFKRMLKDKLYVMPQADARVGWLFKRHFPELYVRVMAKLYSRRLWIFKHLEKQV